MATSLRSVSCIKPLGCRVLVQRLKAEQKTVSGIFLPEKYVKIIFYYDLFSKKF